MTVEIPQGYTGETPKVKVECDRILSIVIELKPSCFDYKVEPNAVYRFVHQSDKRRINSRKAGNGIGLLIKGFFNIFGSKK